MNAVASWCEKGTGVERGFKPASGRAGPSGIHSAETLGANDVFCPVLASVESLLSWEWVPRVSE